MSTPIFSLPRRDLEKLTSKLFLNESYNINELLYAYFKQIVAELQNPPVQYDLESLLWYSFSLSVTKLLCLWLQKLGILISNKKLVLLYLDCVKNLWNQTFGAILWSLEKPTRLVISVQFSRMAECRDIDVVKEELYSIDKWVTGLVDLIPTQVYVRKFHWAETIFSIYLNF